MGNTKAFALGKELAYKEDVPSSGGITTIASDTFVGAVKGGTAASICNINLNDYPDASIFYARLKRMKIQHTGALMDSNAAIYVYVGLSDSTRAAINISDQYALAGFEFPASMGGNINIDRQLRASTYIQLLAFTNESNPDFTHCYYWGGSRPYDGERLTTDQIADITRIKYLKIIASPSFIGVGESINIEADYSVYAM